MARIIGFPDNDPNRHELGGETELIVNENKLTQLLTDLNAVIKTMGPAQKAGLFDPDRNSSIHSVSNYTDAELIGWVNNHNPADIPSKPMFFCALVERMKLRGLIRRK